MHYTDITKLNKKWSAITFGCWQLAPSGGWGNACSLQDADAAVKAALDGGITAFDTAEGYGDGESERRLGRALGMHKDEVIIISKIWPDAELAQASYQRHLDESLLALGRDYVDLYLIHWPGDKFDTVERTKRLSDCMLALKASGKAKLVGLSNFQAKDLSLFDESLAEFSINQVPYSLLNRKYEDETLRICKANQLPYMAYSPTAQGLLAGRLTGEAIDAPTRQGNPLYQEPVFSQAKEVYRALQDMANEIGCKPIDLALAWVLHQDNILTAIVGSRKVEQVKDYASAGSLELDAKQLAKLQEISETFVDAKLQAPLV